MADISIIMGSISDAPIAEGAKDILDEAGVKYDMQVLSAHRDPEALYQYIKSTDAKVFICIAGLSAALPGVVASLTDKPVIGVPISTKLGGLDALLSIVQMPEGVPVACVGIDNVANAAHLAIRILGIK